jgi:hypothetical protein
MAKLAWNDFVTAHPKAVCVYANKSGIKIPAGALAQDGRKLPTAYGMLIEALGRVLKGDWTVRQVGKVIQIVLIQQADLATLLKLFQMGQLPNGSRAAPCAAAFGFVYGPQQYQQLAKGLKYVPAR